jgi:hypothetical protein
MGVASPNTYTSTTHQTVTGHFDNVEAKFARKEQQSFHITPPSVLTYFIFDLLIYSILLVALKTFFLPL